MAAGVVLVPDPDFSKSLISLSRVIGGGADPLMLLGPDAPPHLTVVHAEGDGDLVKAVERYRRWTFEVRVIGLLYSVYPAGDYYVPEGGYYFGIEVTRTPALDALHREFLDEAVSLGMKPLGLTGDDYRPHFTLGMTKVKPALPRLESVPVGTFQLSIAGGVVGPYGTFPGLEMP